MNKEYKDLLLDLYKENQSFLNKLILGVSSLAIPLLYKSALEISDTYTALSLSFSLFAFLIVIILQIWSLLCARDGCDDSMSNDQEKQKNGTVLLNKAKSIDTWRNAFFILALSLIIISLIINIFNKETNAMSDKKNPKELINSYTPPKAMIDTGSFTPPNAMIEQKSFTPPKAVIEQQAPAAPQAQGTQEPAKPSGNDE